MSENLEIVTSSGRSWFLLALYQRDSLRSQLELMLTILIRWVESKRITYDQQEIVLELVRDLCCDPVFPVHLYINYDCQLETPNLFENLCKFLYKVRVPLD